VEFYRIRGLQEGDKEGEEGKKSTQKKKKKKKKIKRKKEETQKRNKSNTMVLSWRENLNQNDGLILYDMECIICATRGEGRGGGYKVTLGRRETK